MILTLRNVDFSSQCFFNKKKSVHPSVCLGQIQSESSEPSTQTLDTEPRCLCLTIWNISLVLSLSPILEFFMHILTFKGDTVL